MRVVHFAALADTGHVVPWCGVWGSMDSDWTDIANNVSCLGCATAMAHRDGKGVAQEASSGASVAATRSPGSPTSGLQRLASATAGAWTRHRPRLRPA